jgi:hypothetical protein
VYQEIHEEVIVPVSATPSTHLSELQSAASQLTPKSPDTAREIAATEIPASQLPGVAAPELKPKPKIRTILNSPAAPEVSPRPTAEVPPGTPVEVSPRASAELISSLAPVGRFVSAPPAQTAPAAAPPRQPQPPAAEVRRVFSRIETGPELEVEIVEPDAPEPSLPGLAAQPVAPVLSADSVAFHPRGIVRPTTATATKPPSIEVRIGRIEVIVESEPQPPIGAARPPATSTVAPAPSRQPSIGHLARQYLDR